MRLSIIIPVLNEEERISSCLERLQLLRKRAHEVIVVDGGSTDATRTLALPLCTRLLRSRRGRATQMNLGARFAGGDILVFLHVDSSLPEQAERELADAWADGKPGWGWFDVRLSGRSPVFRVIAALMNLRVRLSSVCTGDQTLYVSAALFREAGGFPDIPLMEDIAISKNLRKRARPRPLRGKALASSRRWETDGVARTILQMWQLRLLYFLGVSPGRLAAMYYPSLYADAGGRFKYPKGRIVIFAREPRAGEVKTRLAAGIGAESALRLYRAMLRRVVETVESAALAEFHLWAASNPEHEEFLALCNAQDIHLQQRYTQDTHLNAQDTHLNAEDTHLQNSQENSQDTHRQQSENAQDTHRQQSENLGARMLHAAAHELSADGVEYVLIIGADCPALEREYLGRALAALDAGSDVVLGPARDGGYVLIGLREARQELFRNVDWGTSKVMLQTLAHIRRLQLSHQSLEPLWDVDDVDDLPLLEELRPPLSWSC